MTHTITLTGAYGQTQYRVTGLDAGTTINANDASWIIDNDPNDGDGTNTYPFLVYNSPGVIIEGGVMWGEVSQTGAWEDVYHPANGNGNSAAIRVESSPGALIQDWRIDKAWDALRIAPGTQNFIIQDVWATNIRDDAIENDPANSGTISDSLFDGVFVGLSLDGDRYGGNDVITMDGVLMRMQSYLYKDKVTHGSMFKTDSGNFDSTPDLRLFNNVFAIENPNHESFTRLQAAWDHVTASQNNYLLNLSDTPLPSNYPKPPPGFAILQGQVAREYWELVKATWIAEHDGTSPTDRFPDAVDDIFVAYSGQAGTVADVLANDGLGDPPTNITVYDSISTGGGSVSLNGDDFTYTSALGFVGTDMFTYTIADADGTADTATVWVSVEPQPSDLPAVFEKRINSGLDDVEQRGLSVNLSSSDLELVTDGSTSQVVGLRFTDIEIPRGATITKAYIQFTTDETKSVPTSIIIKGNDVGDATAFAATAYNVSSRAMTDSVVFWDTETWNTIGETHDTPDMSAIVDEIVNRSDWVSGNDMAFIISGSGTRTAEAFESGAATAPLLHIEFRGGEPDLL